MLSCTPDGPTVVLLGPMVGVVINGPGLGGLVTPNALVVPNDVFAQVLALPAAWTQLSSWVSCGVVNPCRARWAQTVPLFTGVSAPEGQQNSSKSIGTRRLFLVISCCQLLWVLILDRICWMRSI